jgi:hypothetical protein
MVEPLNELDQYHKAQRTLERLLPRIEADFSAYAVQNPHAWGQFQTRLSSIFRACSRSCCIYTAINMIFSTMLKPCCV